MHRDSFTFTFIILSGNILKTKQLFSVENAKQPIEQWRESGLRCIFNLGWNYVILLWLLFTLWFLKLERGIGGGGGVFL
jgi:hypothetical protein